MSTVQVTASVPAFDAQHPKYKCCCSCCHVKTGTLILGILATVGVLSSPLVLKAQSSSIAPISDHFNVSATLLTVGAVGSGAFYAFEAVAVVCLFLALAKEIAPLLLPFSILIAIRSVCQFAFAFLFIVLACMGKTMGQFWIDNVINQDGHVQPLNPGEKTVIRTMMTVVCVLVAIGFVLAGAIEIWFFTVVRACSTYFHDEAAYRLKDADIQGPGFNYERMQ